MTRAFSRWIAVALLIVLTTLPAFSQERPSELMDARREITSANDNWQRAFRNANPDLASAQFHRQGAILSPDGHVTYGRAQVLSRMRDWMKQLGPLEATMQTQRLWKLGGLVYESGTYRYVDPDGDFESEGEHLTIWSRDEGGRYRIYRQIVLPQ